MFAYPALVVGALFLMSGSSCTALVSEKPIFPPADYDAAGSLIGRYSPVNREVGFPVLVTRGPDSQIVILTFGQAHKAEEPDVLVQTFYLEGSAVPLGDGDYVLQIACAAQIENGKAYATEIGGKDSPYRSYTSYLTVARDRKEEHAWVSFEVSYSSEDKEAELLFNRYGIKEDSGESNGGTSGYRVRIIPPDITKPAAVSLFRDLVTLDMKHADRGALYRRTDRDPHVTDEEKRAIVLNDSAECHRIQYEGYSHDKAPAENGAAPPPPPPPPPK